MNRERLNELRVTFNHFDSDKDGSIDVEEFSRLLSALGASFNPQEVQVGFTAIDGDGSGRIDFEEFVAWFAQS